MFDVDQTSHSIAAGNVWCPDKVYKRSNILQYMMLDEMLNNTMNLLNCKLLALHAMIQMLGSTIFMKIISHNNRQANKEANMQTYLLGAL